MTSATLRELLDTIPQRGRVIRLGVRPARRAPFEERALIELDPEIGIRGDRYAGRSGKRQVTLVQHEHLAVIGALLGRDAVDSALLRRNVVVAGINLLALSRQRFALGEALLEATGACHPCSRMEQALGPGGYNAMRGHGGLTARVLRAGTVRAGDAVTLVPGATA